MGQIIRCPVCYEWVGIEEADAHHERHRASWTFKNVEVHDRHHLVSDSKFPGKITVGDYLSTASNAKTEFSTFHAVNLGKPVCAVCLAPSDPWDGEPCMGELTGGHYVEPDDQVLSAPILQGKTLFQEIGEKMGAAAGRREDKHRMKQFNSFTKRRKQ